MAVAFIALFLALTGTATAAKLITGKNIARSTITGKHVKDRSLSAADFSGALAGAAGPRGRARHDRREGRARAAGRPRRAGPARQGRRRRRQGREGRGRPPGPEGRQGDTGPQGAPCSPRDPDCKGPKGDPAPRAPRARRASDGRQGRSRPPGFPGPAGREGRQRAIPASQGPAGFNGVARRTASRVRAGPSTGTTFEVRCEGSEKVVGGGFVPDGEPRQLRDHVPDPPDPGRLEGPPRQHGQHLRHHGQPRRALRGGLIARTPPAAGVSGRRRRCPLERTPHAPQVRHARHPGRRHLVRQRARDGQRLGLAARRPRRPPWRRSR